ncbi:hypothetical protein [Thiolinea disciformis]|uniref:hypothetical protein n=1 Tax=Thiolinea disciformis TaxID=125614 RepID=UPI00036B6944|nr:hypothetical protein [Thiolinea disciformis]
MSKSILKLILLSLCSGLSFAESSVVSSHETGLVSTSARVQITVMIPTKVILHMANGEVRSLTNSENAKQLTQTLTTAESKTTQNQTTAIYTLTTL